MKSKDQILLEEAYQQIFENYQRLPSDIEEYIKNTIIAKYKEITTVVDGIVVLDLLKLVEKKDYKASLGDYGSIEVSYRFTPVFFESISKKIRVILDCVGIGTVTASGAFGRDIFYDEVIADTIVIKIPCCPVLNMDETEKEIALEFCRKEINSENLKKFEAFLKNQKSKIDNLLEPKFIENPEWKVSWGLQSSVAKVQRTAEHEFIHAVDYAKMKIKVKPKTRSDPNYQTYKNNYYKYVHPKTGKIPDEFNTLFYNFIKLFDVRFSSNAKKFLISFAKNPKPFIEQLKSSKVTGEFAQFIQSINMEVHIKNYILTVFEDPYLTKKFLQKLAVFINEN